MKTLAELQAIRDRLKQEMENRQTDSADTLVIVGMATCGIAAGARPVLTAFMNEVSARKLHKVKISQAGCIGMCRQEPLVEVIVPGMSKVTYVKMTPDKVSRVVREHIIGGTIVEEFTATKGE